jgi:hypothetical protein
VRPSIALILTLSLAFAARAEDPVFAGAVARSADLEGTASKIEAGLREALELSSVGSIAATGSSAGTGLQPEELDRLLSDARGRYLEGDFRGAAKQTQEGVKRFEENAAFSEAPKLWQLYSELLLVQALAYGRLDNTRAGDRAWVKLAAVRPDYVPDPGLTPPKAATRYQKLRDGLLAKQAKLEIVSVPAGARALVDGKEVGLTPLTVSLPQGTHFVTAKSGASGASERVRLRKSTTVRLTVGDPRAARAKALLSAIKDGSPETQMGERAREVGAAVYVALVERMSGDITVLLGRFMEGRLDTVTALPYRNDLSDIEDASMLLAQSAVTGKADAWSAGEQDPAPLRGRFLKLEESGPDPDPPPGDGSVWVWVGVGGAVVAVAAAAGVGGYFLLNQSPNPGGLDVIVDTSGL